MTAKEIYKQIWDDMFNNEDITISDTTKYQESNQNQQAVGFSETDWRDAQYDMLYLSVTESIRFHYDRTGNLIHRELVDCEVQNYFYDRHDQLVKAEIFKKDGTKLLEIP